MTYKHRGADGESFYNGILIPSRDGDMRGMGDVSAEQRSNARNVGTYSNTGLRTIPGVTAEVIDMYPEPWGIPEKQLIHKFLREFIPAFRKGESIRARLPFGVIVAGPEGWFIEPAATAPGSSFGRGAV